MRGFLKVISGWDGIFSSTPAEFLHSSFLPPEDAGRASTISQPSWALVSVPRFPPAANSGVDVWQLDRRGV